MLIALLRRHLPGHRAGLSVVVLLQLVQTLATLGLPALNATLIDDGIARGDIGYILRTGAIMLAVTLLQVVCSVTAVWFGARAAMGIGRDVRATLFAHVQTFSAQEMGRFGAPTLITRTTNDVQQVQMVVLMSAIMLVTAPIMLVGGVVMALREDAVLSRLLLVAVPLLVVLVALVARRLVPLFRLMQKRIDRINAVLREQLGGLRVIRAFVRERHEARRFARANDELRDTSVQVGRLMALMFPMVMFVMNVSSVAVVWFGGLRIDDGQMQVGSMVAFLAYLMQILMSVLMAVMMFVIVPRAEVSAERVMEVLGTDSSVVPPADPAPSPPRTGRVELRDVSFRYPGAEADVLHEVTLTFEPGRTTAIVGSTGAGKTTLLNLVPRLSDVTAGQVLLDGVDVRRLSAEDLGTRIGLVPQRPYLFTGTIASNLRYGDPEATDEQLWAALEVAQAKDFVAEMDGGLEAPVSQGGSNVSGGQRQRLAIARALVRRPSLYLFDDSFSALDYSTDAALRAALVPVTRDAAVVVVGQRIASVRHADQIVVLDEGRVVGVGTHEQLLRTCPTYVEIAESQLEVAR